MINDFMNDVLNAQWLSDLVMLMLNVLTGIVRIILLPIDLIIKQWFPGFNDVLSNLQYVFDSAAMYAGWFISAFAIPTTVLSIVVIYYTFIIMARFYMWFIKTAMRWIKMMPGA